jgi:hypothetical protein
VWGVVSLVAPAARRAHWLSVAAELRGQRARAEATVRNYVMRSGAAGASSANATGVANAAGVALDISMLEADNSEKK